MSPKFYTLLAGIIALIAGGAIGYLLRQIITSKRISSAQSKAEALLNQAKSDAQNVVLEAQNKSLKILEDAKKDEEGRRRQFNKAEEILVKRERELETQHKEINKEKNVLETTKIDLESVKAEVVAKRQQAIERLETIAQLKREDAKELLFKNLEEEYRDDLYQKIKRIEQSNNEEIDRRAREILTMSVQRYAGSHIADFTTTVVSLPSDEIKGKIIGREGRNIKTIERLTGVDIIID